MKQYKHKVGLLLCGILYAQAPTVVGYDMWLDSISFAAQWWQWRAGVVIQPLGASTLRLLLKGYVVDSVKVGTTALSFTYIDTLLQIFLPSGLGAQETVMVFYRGGGALDPTGRGGVYWGSNAVSNVGVSFAYVPHSFGRAWHPCIDTFGHKAFYRFHLRVPEPLAGTANGLLDSVTPAGAGWKRWHWHVTHPLPAYLAGVAIGNYVAATDTFIRAPGDTIPIQYWVRRSDSAGVFVTFQRLKTLLRDWETKFGPYPHERIGYVATAVTSLAMEHSTHIVYPEIIISNNTSYDWLWAHELCHEWFGNSVTGSSEAQIFLKEGFATLGEALYYERFFNKQRYYDYIRDFLETTLRELRWEEGLFPLSAIPPEHTYGIATYQKGATVLNTLRHQLGDSLYFRGMRAYTTKYKHKLVTLDSLQKVLEDSLGVILNHFFDDWLRKAGEVHFRIDSFGRQGNDSVWIAWRIGLRDKPSYHTPTRLTVYLRGTNPGDTLYAQFFTDGNMSGRAVIACGFTPQVAVLNPRGEVSDASTHGVRMLKNTANVSLPQVYLTLRPVGLPANDSVWVHAALNWVGAYDAAGLPLSTRRYHQLDGVWSQTVAMRGFFQYNGTGIGTGAYLDTTWLNFQEDSLALYWRPNPKEPWREWKPYTVETGNSLTDRRGRIVADSLLPGEYVIGKKGHFTTPIANASRVYLWSVKALDGVIYVENASLHRGEYAVYDILGRVYHRGYLQPGESIQLHMPSNLYLIQTPEGVKKVLLF
ncbi:MAG: M1 family metallopeptidase [Bacteroidia bacterium]|nr:M1 family metallopeptidase [Bacteroidia bacterium]MCX7652811.1 M1 family metallopeptidase [Bacteroidia bacterium]MDW8417232.1 M1 family metallopeptidase [Bacteroidia bacterium]